jgi:hypothetical protein
MELGDLRHEDFSNRVGDQFEVDLGDGSTVSLVLTAASEPPDDRPDHAHFVEWTGPLDHPLEQGIHELRHAEWGTLALFLVPVNQVAEGFVYEAVFTRVEE